MELAIQETKAFLENLEHKEILVNGAKQGLRGFVMFQYVIRRTTSGNITAKDPTSDNIAVWEGLLWNITESLMDWEARDRWLLHDCVWRTSTLEAEIASIVDFKKNRRDIGSWLEFMLKGAQQTSHLAY